METKYMNTFWKTKSPCLIIEMYGNIMTFASIEDSEYIPWEIISYADDFKLDYYNAPISIYIITWMNSPYGVPVEQFHSCFEQAFITDEEYIQKVNTYVEDIRKGKIK